VKRGDYASPSISNGNAIFRSGKIVSFVRRALPPPRETTGDVSRIKKCAREPPIFRGNMAPYFIPLPTLKRVEDVIQGRRKEHKIRSVKSSTLNSGN
jgi:hypothetical protein